MPLRRITGRLSRPPETEDRAVSEHPGWMLVIVGLVTLAAGLLWILFPSVPGLGRLPGDIRIETEHTRVYIPIMTCLLLSIALTAILSLVRWFSQ
jgi:hypothetical protein